MGHEWVDWDVVVEPTDLGTSNPSERGELGSSRTVDLKQFSSIGEFGVWGESVGATGSYVSRHSTSNSGTLASLQPHCCIAVGTMSYHDGWWFSPSLLYFVCRHS